MTAGPYSLEDWFALGDDESVRVELLRGIPQQRESRRPRQSGAVLKLTNALDSQLPESFAVYQRIDVILEHTPATVRSPDVVVIHQGAPEPTLARDIVLAVEVLAPATFELDRVTKREEYAAANIPNYWIIDPAAQSAEILVLADSGYEGQAVSGRIRVDVPTALDIDLTALDY